MLKRILLNEYCLYGQLHLLDDKQICILYLSVYLPTHIISASHLPTLHRAKIKKKAAICYSFTSPFYRNDSLLSYFTTLIVRQMASLLQRDWLVAKIMFPSFISTCMERLSNICYVTVSVSHKSIDISETFWNLCTKHINLHAGCSLLCLFMYASTQ